MSIHPAIVVMRPHWDDVFSMEQSLIHAVDARTYAVLTRRLERLLLHAKESVHFANSLYTAVQVLRDAEALSAPEAVFICRKIFAVWAADSTAPRSRLADGKHGAQALEIQFHRARGETGLAELLASSPERAMEVMELGRKSLALGRLNEFHDVPRKTNPRVVAGLREYIGSIVTAESVDQLRSWKRTVYSALRRSDTASAIAAVQELRDAGVISPAQAVGLLAGAVDLIVNRELQRDREARRLQRQLDELRGDGGPYADSSTMENRVAATREFLRQRLAARTRAIYVACLRRLGEQQAASALVEEGENYPWFKPEALPGALDAMWPTEEVS